MLASHLIQGMAQAGMASCGKHFPGHGWTRADSHHDIPRDERSLRRILDQDAAPYGWLGIGLASVMPAHVIYPKVDAHPAGFSRHWIEDVLRARLGFAGAIYSDDLSMAGAAVAGPLVQRAAAALNAGCDFILVCNDPEGCDQLLEELTWSRGSSFEARLARLRPRGPTPDPDHLGEDPAYCAALRDLESRSTSNRPRTALHRNTRSARARSERVKLAS
jgi:beta-N-acetylhexosaminidase